MINVAIIGYGYWGKNIVRNFYGTPNCNIKFVADLKESNLAAVKKAFPNLATTSDTEMVFADAEIDAVIIATPVFTHFKLAKAALLAGKHVLVEKPMTSSAEDARELIELAKKQGKLLMVDHTFLYTGAVQKMKELADSGKIGKIKYVDSVRINLGLFQPDVNVLWDLAPHDISICDYLVGEQPYSVQATGVSHTGNGIENIAYLTVNYKSGLIAHFSASWSSPVKIRHILVGGDQKMIAYNDLETTEKIKVYDTGYEVKTEEEKAKILVDYRVGDIYVPKLENTEALAGMAKDFINCIINGTEPRSTAELGFRVVQVLAAAQISIKENGREVII